MKKIIQKIDITKEKTRDAGLIIVFLLLLLGNFSGKQMFFHFATPTIIIVFLFPKLFYPFAVFWYGLSEILGTIISKIVLTAIYFSILVPTGLVRKMAGKDSLKLRLFKKSSKSVFIDRNKKFSLKDIQQPY